MQITDLNSKESIFCYCMYKYGSISLPKLESLQYIKVSEKNESHIIRLLSLISSRIADRFRELNIESRLCFSMKQRPSPIYEKEYPLIRIYTSDKGLNPETSLFFGYMVPKNDIRSEEDMKFSLPMYSLLECELWLLTLQKPAIVYTGNQLYRSEIWDEDKYRFYKHQQDEERILSRKYAESAPLFSTSFKQHVADWFLSRCRVRSNQRKCLLKFRQINIEPELLQSFKEYFPESIVYENADISRLSEIAGEGEILVSNGCFFRVLSLKEDKDKLDLSILMVNGSIRSVINSLYRDQNNEVKINMERIAAPPLYFLDSNIFEEMQKHALLIELSKEDDRYKPQALNISNVLQKYFHQLPQFLGILYSLNLEFSWCLTTARRKIWNKVTFSDYFVKNVDASCTELFQTVRRNLKLIMFVTTDDFRSNFGSLLIDLLDSLISYSKMEINRSELQTRFIEDYEKLCPEIQHTRIKQTNWNQQEVLHYLRNIERESLKIPVAMQNYSAIDKTFGEFLKLYYFLKISFKRDEILLKSFESSFKIALNESLDRDDINDFHVLVGRVAQRLIEIIASSEKDKTDSVHQTISTYNIANKILLESIANAAVNGLTKSASLSANFAKGQHFHHGFDSIFDHIVFDKNEMLSSETKNILRRTWTKCFMVPFDSISSNPILIQSSSEFLEYLGGTCSFMLNNRDSIELFDINDLIRNLMYSLFVSAMFNIQVCDMDWSPAYNYLKASTFCE